MKHRVRSYVTCLIAVSAVCLALGMPLSALYAQQAPAPAASRGPGPGPGQGGFAQASDPRVQNRTYHFADTNEDLPYCVFVSSKVSEDKKNPLIVSLHGMGIGPGFMCRGKALDLAEEGGYILVAPMGYNTTGWYGSPVIRMGGRGPGPGPGAARGPGAPGPGVPGPGAPVSVGPGRGATGPAGMPPAPPAPDNLAELSEKDVLNVLAIIRKEFNVDDQRTYLMGHSMGGAGTLFLGSKHANEWAALASIAPASFMMNNDRASILQKIKEAGVPLLLTSGDADEAVPVTNTRMWAETLKELGLNHEYKEFPGVTHGPIIEAAMPDIFAFFAKHSKGP
ncbi:MAG: prolyl oligopeptidase family serine peptidase [Gammaproteobacteria bacterium]|nr:prolyl oligopeptidase family serine peptidase [Gammaproteobacteria bacterium]